MARNNGRGGPSGSPLSLVERSLAEADRWVSHLDRSRWSPELALRVELDEARMIEATKRCRVEDDAPTDESLSPDEVDAEHEAIIRQTVAQLAEVAHERGVEAKRAAIVARETYRLRDVAAEGLAVIADGRARSERRKSYQRSDGTWHTPGDPWVAL